MARRSLRASPAGIEKATTALISKAWTHEQLAEKLDLCTRWSVSQFFRGKTVKRQTFVEICQKLDLDWKEIREAESEEEEQDNGIDIDALVQKVRQHCHDKIQI